MEHKQILSECPYCHEKPTVHEYDGPTESRKRTLYGNIRYRAGTTFYSCIGHLCPKLQGTYDDRRMYVEGRCTLWGNFDGGLTSRVYDPEEYERSRDHATEIVIRKWNKMVRKIEKDIKNGK